MTDAPLSYADSAVRLSPPWLQRTEGARVMRGLVDVIDTLRDTAAKGVKARFPGLTDVDDGLAVIGRERRIVRGLNEPATTYAARLKRWWDDHGTRGGPYALLAQLYAFWSLTPRQIDLVYCTGNVFSMDAAGAVTRSSFTTNADPAKWARASIFFYTTDPGDLALTYEQTQEYMAVPREWNAAHMAPLNVFLLAPGGRAWGWPRSGFWNDPNTATWGRDNAIRVNDLYPSGP